MLFLFKPFGPATLAAVVEKVRSETHNGVRIAYAQTTKDEVSRPSRGWGGRGNGASSTAPDVAFYRSA